MSRAAGKKKAGRPVKYVFSIWAGIAIISGIASLVGFVIFSGFSAGVIAATTAGAILAILADTMIPEAFDVTHDYAGLITVFGYLCAFLLSKHG